MFGCENILSGYAGITCNAIKMPDGMEFPGFDRETGLFAGSYTRYSQMKEDVPLDIRLEYRLINEKANPAV